MRSVLLASLLWTVLAVRPAPAQPVPHGERIAFDSTVLGTERAYQIYRPPSYPTDPDRRYPVMVLVDGEYHFHYVSGLLEQMGGVGEQIPEMILVATTHEGTPAYRQEITPTVAGDDSPPGGEGGATRFLDFLERDLIPHVERAERTAPHRVLVGLSLGGLFAVATLLDRPALFDSVIAVSPSMWWQDHAWVAEAERVLEASPDFAGRLYLTVADERGMGVFGLADVLDRKAPRGLRWRFRHAPEETHDTTGSPALRWALENAFEGYGMTSARFRALDDAEALVDIYRALTKEHGFSIPPPPRALANIVGVYRRESPEQLAVLEAALTTSFPAERDRFDLIEADADLAAEAWTEALEGYRAVLARDEESIDALWGAAKALRGLGDRVAAREHLDRVFALVGDDGLRPWQMAELRADRETLAE